MISTITAVCQTRICDWFALFFVFFITTFVVAVVVGGGDGGDHDEYDDANDDDHVVVFFWLGDQRDEERSKQYTQNFGRYNIYFEEQQFIGNKLQIYTYYFPNKPF